MEISPVGPELFPTDIQTDRCDESNCHSPDIIQLKRLCVPLLFIFACSARLPAHNNCCGLLKIGNLL